jgi:hypothetical protein
VHGRFSVDEFPRLGATLRPTVSHTVSDTVEAKALPIAFFVLEALLNKIWRDYG